MRHLIDAAGNPFMMHGDTAWSLIASLSKPDATLYLDDRSARGFNTILVELISHKFTQNAPANFYGDRPFLTAGDFATPNEAYFAHADWVIEQAESRGILVLLTPAYIGFGGLDEGWYQEMGANGTTKLRAYGRYVATRLAARRNILWVHGGDWNPPDKARVSAIAEGVREVDASALHTAHCDFETAAREYWADQSWLNVNNVYERTLISSATVTEYQRSPSMPVFFIEGTYENETCCGPAIAEDGLRRQVFHSVLSGAFGHIFGNNPIWHMNGPGLSPAPTDWKGALNSRGAQSMAHALTVLNQARWSTLVPDLSNLYLTGGLSSGDSRAVAAVGAGGATAIAYVPTVGSITINLARLTGPRVLLRWFDPSTGVYTTVDSTPVPNTGSRNLSPPGQNSRGYGDWVLLAESIT